MFKFIKNLYILYRSCVIIHRILSTSQTCKLISNAHIRNKNPQYVIMCVYVCIERICFHKSIKLKPTLNNRKLFFTLKVLYPWHEEAAYKKMILLKIYIIDINLLLTSIKYKYCVLDKQIIGTLKFSQTIVKIYKYWMQV